VREGLPTGTVTFLFTDIEASTKLLHELGAGQYARELARHRSILREAFSAHGGVEIDTQGDACFAAFTDAQGAVNAARQAQLGLRNGPVAVRVGVHSGEPLVWAEGYVGVDVHRGARICAAAHGGQVIVSQRTRELVKAPFVDLGLHRLKDLSEPQHLFQIGDVDFPPLRTLYRTNLSVQPSPLVGRMRELGEASELLATHRLLTLTGPGGSGKTRLALQLAADAVEDYPDGVYWIPLQAVRDAKLVLPAISSALGAKDTLTDHIADGRLLLLLDNFEQVITAAPLLSELLSRTPNVTIIATSREPLRISGESRYAVEPLPEDDAVALFSERAQAVDAGFQPVKAVADICRRLDNLPLALELAAARVAVLDPESLLARLEPALPVLTHGARDAPERQRTLRATIDWSYNLLDRAAQTDFARLSVFAGSFDAESAEAVCGVGLDALQSLVEKSLVRRWGGRFGLLDTIHELAMVRFGELRDQDEVRRRHAEHFIALAEAARPELRGEAHGTWLDRLETERENFRAALSWTADSGRLDLTCRLAAGFAPFWASRGSRTEAHTWMETTLPARGTLAREHRAPYLRWASSVAAESGEHDHARALCEEALALSRAQGDAEGEGQALMQMAYYAFDDGRPDEAADLLEQAADAWRRVGTGWGLPGIAMNLGNLAVERGEYERAEELYAESLAAYRALKSPANVMFPLVNLADLWVERGLPREAAEPLREALDIAVDLEDHRALASVLNMYSHVAVAEGSWERAAILLGARDHLLEVTGARLNRGDEQRALGEQETVEAELGAAAFTKAWTDGAAMELDAVLRFVRNGG
jgi:predicted ATPase/class 3 adenylate cyclase